MRLAFIILLLSCLGLSAATTRITATLSVTNSAGTTNGQTLVVNGNTRTWTNNVTVPATQVLTNSSATGAKTNLYNAIALTKFPQTTLVDRGSTNFDLVASSGFPITVTPSAGWAIVTYSTQVVSSMIVVSVPIASEPSGAQQTNIASLLVSGIDSLSTNAFTASSPAVANLLGLTGTQTASGVKTFTGANIYSNSAQLFSGGTVSNANIKNASSISGTLGILTNGTFLNPVFTNGQNIGTAFSSRNTYGDNNEVFGNGARADSPASYGTVVGKSAYASNTYATAIGSAAIAGGNNSTVIGEAAYAYNQNSTALGSQARTINFDTATAIGFDAEATADHQIMIGTATEFVRIPGNLSSATISNAYFISTNNFPVNSDVAFGRYANSSLANGNNAGVVIGTNVFMEVSGPSSAFTINGIAGGRDGKLIIILNLTGQNMTIAHDSGTDPTAANRIYTMTGADRATTGNGAATLIYNANSSRWILIAIEQ